MALVRKKDDKNLKVLREIVSLNGNKQCFDCGQRGPTYVNMTIGSFVCTRCSGVLRGLTPPQRIKSISMATFTADEIEFIRSNGNDACSKTWMGLWDPKRTVTQEHRDLLIDKYERKRYFLEPASPLKSITSSQKLMSLSQSSSTTTSDNSSALQNITLTPPTSLRLPRAGQTQNLNGGRNFQQQFTPDDSTNSLFNQTNHQQIRLNNNNNNNNNPLNGLNRNGLNLASTKNCLENNNKFTPETEFIADFSSANIFNANGINSNNNNGSCLKNGFGGDSNKVKHGVADANSTENGENFADFDHNPIYNANSANQNLQWNVWQQFQWPFIQPEQNRWSLPMSLSSTSNSLHSSGTFHSNSSLNSTPSVDRYAALKDLDEQIRESKEPSQGATQQQHPQQPHPNPFKAPSNPFQHQQPQQASQKGWVNLSSDQLFTPTNSMFPPIQQQQQQQQQQPQQQNGFGSQINNVGSTVGGGFNGYIQTNGQTNGFSAGSNPFAIGNKSNNPFL